MFQLSSELKRSFSAPVTFKFCSGEKASSVPTRCLISPYPWPWGYLAFWMRIPELLGPVLPPPESMRELAVDLVSPLPGAV